MFTGIITDLGAVRAVEPGSEGRDTRFVFSTGYDTGKIAIGASIACSGPCLTVTDKGKGWFAAEASAETLARTTMGRWSEGTPVNLERSLTAGQELGGHIVTGHVDGVSELLSRMEEGGSVRFVFSVPPGLARFIAEKGSVALDGVSLTVNEVEDPGNGAPARFAVNIIRHTLEMTLFGRLGPGDQVNLEVDMLARYVDRQMEARQ